MQHLGDDAIESGTGRRVAGASPGRDRFTDRQPHIHLPATVLSSQPGQSPRDPTAKAPTAGKDHHNIIRPVIHPEAAHSQRAQGGAMHGLDVRSDHGIAAPLHGRRLIELDIENHPHRSKDENTKRDDELAYIHGTPALIEETGYIVLEAAPAAH